MKALSKSDKLKVLIVPKMKYIIPFLENKLKSAVYTGGNIHRIYRYLDMIGAPTTLTTSGQCSHNFGPSSSTKKDNKNPDSYLRSPHETEEYLRMMWKYFIQE